MIHLFDIQHKGDILSINGQEELKAGIYVFIMLYHHNNPLEIVQYDIGFKQLGSGRIIGRKVKQTESEKAALRFARELSRHSGVPYYKEYRDIAPKNTRHEPNYVYYDLLRSLDEIIEMSQKVDKLLNEFEHDGEMKAKIRASLLTPDQQLAIQHLLETFCKR